MSIKLKENKFHEDETCGGGWSTLSWEIIIHNHDTMEAFKTLVNRGMNTWDEAPPEMKEFADILIHGKPLQDYNRSTFSSKK